MILLALFLPSESRINQGFFIERQGHFLQKPENPGITRHKFEKQPPYYYDNTTEERVLISRHFPLGRFTAPAGPALWLVPGGFVKIEKRRQKRDSSAVPFFLQIGNPSPEKDGNLCLFQPTATEQATARAPRPMWQATLRGSGAMSTRLVPKALRSSFFQSLASSGLPE